VEVAAMADKHRVEVEILGQKYAIRTDADADYVRDLAAYVEERVRDIRGDGPAQDPVKLLALAALYITDELFRVKDDHALLDKDTSARLDALNRLLDGAAHST
jgi:cell division protein ZapA (FtsZ GTPase activity inhibitor)